MVTSSQSPFTPQFQREMLVVLLQCPEAYEKFRDIWSPSYFADHDHVRIATAFLKVLSVGHEHPARISVEQELFSGLDLKNPTAATIALQKEVEIIYDAKPQNPKFTVEVIRQFSSNSAVSEAIGVAIDHLRSGETDKIAALVRQALTIGKSKKNNTENVINDLLISEIDDKQNILGNRLLERGTFGVVIGHSGAGKSTLAVQVGAELAANHLILGIRPARPLKVLVVQAEDSRNDRVDQVRLVKVLIPDKEDQLEMADRFWMHSTTSRGEELFTELKELNDQHERKFDLFILNPAFSFIQDKGSAEESKDVGHFLRDMLLPFLQETEAAGLIMHHPPKLNNRDTSKWTAAMWQYAAHGSAEWTNSPRFVMNLEETASPTIFQFIISKRGSKSGWQRDGKIFRRYYKHSDPGEPMYWKECSEEDIAEAQASVEVKIDDIKSCFTNGPLTVVQLIAKLKEDGLIVDNDWLVKTLERSPKFRRTGQGWVLEKNARKAEKEQTQKVKDLQSLKVIADLLSVIKDTPEISVNQLSERIKLKKETLISHLDKLENEGRITFVQGARNAKLYSVTEEK